MPDLWVAEDGKWLQGGEGGDEAVRTGDGQRIFEAHDVRVLSIDDIIEANGERMPAHAESQRRFRVAFVLVTDDDHPATPERLEFANRAADWFTREGDDGMDWLYNFHEATGGRASMSAGALTDFAKPEPSVPIGMPASFGRAPDPSACEHVVWPSRLRIPPALGSAP